MSGDADRILWDFASKTEQFKTRKNRTRNFEIMVMSFYRELRPECKHTKSISAQPESIRKLIVFMLMAIAIIVKQYLKLWAATITPAPAKKTFHLCQVKILKREIRSKELMS